MSALREPPFGRLSSLRALATCRGLALCLVEGA